MLKPTLDFLMLLLLNVCLWLQRRGLRLYNDLQRRQAFMDPNQLLPEMQGSGKKDKKRKKESSSDSSSSSSSSSSTGDSSSSSGKLCFRIQGLEKISLGGSCLLPLLKVQCCLQDLLSHGTVLHIQRATKTEFAQGKYEMEGQSGQELDSQKQLLKWPKMKHLPW